MKRVLTVDDSSSMRMIIKKALSSLELELSQAEDGQQGLDQAAAVKPDLILLDITMPVMDGPTMLKELRARGDKTPVILLTAESGTSVIGPLVPLGFTDYIVKPFKAEELQNKVKKLLQVSTKTAANPAEATGDAAAQPAEGKPVVDVLIVDDMENVAKQFRTLLPEAVKMDAAQTAQTASALCRERVYRGVVLDLDIPGVDTASLARQLRAMQPKALFYGLGMRNMPNPEAAAKEKGLDGILLKPFVANNVQDFLGAFQDTGEPVETEENLLRVNPFSGSKDKELRYFTRLSKLVDENIEKMAAACYPCAVMDLIKIPHTPQMIVRMMSSTDSYAKGYGVELRLVVDPEILKILSEFVETAEIKMYSNVNDAKQGNNQIEVKKRAQ